MTFSSTSHFHQKQTQPSPVSPDIWQRHESELMTVGWSSVEIRWKWYWLSRKSRRRIWQSLKLFHQLREDKRPLSKWLQFQVLTRFITTPNLPDCRNIIYHRELPIVFSLFLSNSALGLLIYTCTISRAVCSCVGQAGGDGKLWLGGKALLRITAVCRDASAALSNSVGDSWCWSVLPKLIWPLSPATLITFCSSSQPVKGGFQSCGPNCTGDILERGKGGDFWMVNLFHQCPQMSVLTLSREAQGSLVQEITSFSVMYKVENMLPLPVFMSDLGRKEGKWTVKKKIKMVSFFFNE